MQQVCLESEAVVSNELWTDLLRRLADTLRRVAAAAGSDECLLAGEGSVLGFVALLFGGIALSRNIVASTRLGQKSSFVFDCFCLTLAVQLGWLHSGYWWYLYLAIPGYGVYKVVRMLLDWVFTPTQSEMDENRELTPQELKRQKKQE